MIEADKRQQRHPRRGIEYATYRLLPQRGRLWQTIAKVEEKLPSIFFEVFKEIDCLLLVTYAIITKSTAEQGESYGE